MTETKDSKTGKKSSAKRLKVEHEASSTIIIPINEGPTLKDLIAPALADVEQTTLDAEVSQTIEEP